VIPHRFQQANAFFAYAADLVFVDGKQQIRVCGHGNGVRY
jgi:hypothetical protein